MPPRGRWLSASGRTVTAGLALVLAALVLLPSAAAQAPVEASAPLPADDFLLPDPGERAAAEAPSPSNAQRQVTGGEASPAAGGTADEIFDLRTRTIEEKVNDLKEKVHRTKSRLMTLAETVIGGGGISSGAKLQIVHANELGSSYRLIGVHYSLDGAPAYLKVDETAELDKREEITVFDQRVVPGEHLLTVRFNLRGHGYGLFSYLENYTIELTAPHPFSVEPGKITTVRVVVHERPGLTLDFKDRPDIRFETTVQKDLKREDAAAAAGSSP